MIKHMLLMPATGNRQYKRYVIHGIKIKLYTAGALKLLKKEFPTTLLINISQDGFQAVSRYATNSKSTYIADMDVPVLGSVYAKASSVWCRPFTDDFRGQFYRSGFMFTNLSKRNLKKLSVIDNGVQCISSGPTPHWGYLPDEANAIDAQA